MNQLLKELNKIKEFQTAMEEALKNRPIVPAFAICKTKDEQDMVVENIKYYTALRNGWDLLYSQLTGKTIFKE